MKPKCLEKAIQPCLPGHVTVWAGDVETSWAYDLGTYRLQEIELQVVAASNLMRGSDNLSKSSKV